MIMLSARFPRFNSLLDRAQHRSRHQLGTAMRGVAIIVLLMNAASHAAMAQTASPNPAWTMKSRDGSYAGFVTEASRRFAIPAPLIGAVMQVESNGDSHAVSPKGAMGLMQLMPGTWIELRARYRLGTDPFDSHDNILAGTAYLRQMYDRFGETGFLAAYNAGPGRYEIDLATGQPLPVETQVYLAKIVHLLGNGQISGNVLADTDPFAWMQSSLFVRQMTNGPANGIAHNDSTMNVRTGRAFAEQSVGKTFALAPQSNGLFVRGAASGELP